MGTAKHTKPFLAFGLSCQQHQHSRPSCEAICGADSCFSRASASLWRVYGSNLMGEFTRTRSTADPSDTKAHSSPRVASFMNAECLLVEFPIVPRPPPLGFAGGNDATVSCFKDDINMQIDAWPPVLCLCVCTCACVVRLPHLNIKVTVNCHSLIKLKRLRFSRQYQKWSITGMLHN